MYLMLGSRPDLAYAVGFLSRSLENPTTEDLARLKRVFRYIASTINLGIMYRQNAVKGVFKSYSDADFGGCTKTGQSTSGVVVIYAGGAISWLSQRQGTVALSSTEAELVAANEGAKEVVWLSRLLQEITPLKEIPALQVDNAPAIRLSENPENHRRTKHIQRRHFFIRELLADKQLSIEKVSSEQQVADVLTKARGAVPARLLYSKMGLI